MQAISRLLQLISGIFFLFTILAKLENKTITTKCVYNLVVSQNSHFIIRLKNVKNLVILGLAELVIPESFQAIYFCWIYLIKIRRVSTVRHGASNLKWIADYDTARPDPNHRLTTGHNLFFQKM